jgi:hypothetical protein
MQIEQEGMTESKNRHWNKFCGQLRLPALTTCPTVTDDDDNSMALPA